MNNLRKTKGSKPAVDTILSDKGNQVGSMFDRIARRYDFLNHFLSLGIDRSWRRKVIHHLRPFSPGHVIDVATGTGDLAIAVHKQLKCIVTGVDVSENMMRIGAQKVKRKKLQERITFTAGKAEDLPFGEASFDAATVAFGVRNFGDLDRGLQEMLRVLKPGGPLVILEFSLPKNTILRKIYEFYLYRLLPLTGKLISGDPAAYNYLPESIKTFPKDDDFLQRMGKAGFEQLSWRPLTGGIVSLYTGQKPAG